MRGFSVTSAAPHSQKRLAGYSPWTVTGSPLTYPETQKYRPGNQTGCAPICTGTVLNHPV